MPIAPIAPTARSCRAASRAPSSTTRRPSSQRAVAMVRERVVIAVDGTRVSPRRRHDLRARRHARVPPRWPRGFARRSRDAGIRGQGRRRGLSATGAAAHRGFRDEHAPQHLADHRLRQLRPELDARRHLVRREPLAAVGAQLVFGRALPGLQHDPGLGDFALDRDRARRRRRLRCTAGMRRDAPLRSRAARPGSRSSSSCPSCDRRGRCSRRRPCRRGRRCAATGPPSPCARSVSAVSTGLFQYSDMCCGARRISSPTSPAGISRSPSSASTMRTSTSGSGMPIDPILFVPCTGLTQHAIIAFGQRVALDDPRAGLLLELPLRFGHQRRGAARSTA